MLQAHQILDTQVLKSTGPLRGWCVVAALFPPAVKTRALPSQTRKWVQLCPGHCTRKSAAMRAREIRVATTECLPKQSETSERARPAAVCSLGLSGVRRGKLPGTALTFSHSSSLCTGEADGQPASPSRRAAPDFARSLGWRPEAPEDQPGPAGPSARSESPGGAWPPGLPGGSGDGGDPGSPASPRGN